tara:strand:+ start:200 stop:613 length:414 start_codon:yes stop_codon:yes gene_type:complete
MYSFENLKIGKSFTEIKKVSEKKIIDFSIASGDKNPIHLNTKYAKKTFFKERIAHGMLIASFISSVIGNKFPGPGTIYISQNLNFLKPVKINDIVKIIVTLKRKIKKKKWCQLSTICYVRNKVVLEGTAVVIPPKRK